MAPARSRGDSAPSTTSRPDTTDSSNSNAAPVQKRSLRALFASWGTRLISPSMKRFFEIWWLETLSLATLTISYAAIVATTCQFRNQPIPKWPLGFSINALLSLYGIAFKGPLLLIAAEGLGQVKWQQFSAKARPLYLLSLFDNASRGPWGAVKLLCGFLGRSTIATLGTLIVIFAMAVDPFTQAVVSYYPCHNQRLDGTASINRANTIESLAWLNLGKITIIPLLDRSIVDQDAIKAPFVCSTGNCTFPQLYHSIGICSSCNDLTKSIHKSCDTNNTSILLSKKPANETGSDMGCEFSVPCPACISDNNLPITNLTVGGIRKDRDEFLWSRLASAGLEYHSETISNEKDFATSSRRPPRSEYNRSDSGPYGKLCTNHWLQFGMKQSDVFAARCSYFVCVKSYTATIDNGRLYEKTVSTSHNWSYSFSETGDGYPSVESRTVDVACLSQQSRVRLLQDNYISSSTLWMAWNGTYLNGTEFQEGLSNSQHDVIPKECVYQFSRLGYFGNPFRAAGGTIDADIKTLPDHYIVTPHFSAVTNTVLLLTMTHSENFETYADAIHNHTIGLTNLLRTVIEGSEYVGLGADGIDYDKLMDYTPKLNRRYNEPTKGIAYGQESCIRVRWSWFALPSTLLLATYIYFVWLVLKTNPEARHHTWKSSPLALLWHGLEGALRREGAWLDTINDMEVRSKEVKVRLRTTAKGRRLVEQT